MKSILVRSGSLLAVMLAALLCGCQDPEVQRQNAEVSAALALRKAAEQGDAVAQNNLGLAYVNGQNVPQNYAEAVKWFRKAAEQGNTEAEINLGLAYVNGQGIPQNYIEGTKWLRMAAERGNANAQCNLGNAYFYGDRGVSKDRVEAYKWYILAASSGHEESIRYRNDLAHDLPPEQVAEGQKRATEFVPKKAPAQANNR